MGALILVTFLTGTLFILLSVAINHNFEKLTFEQVLFHLNSGTELDSEATTLFVESLWIVPLALILAAVGLYFLGRSFEKTSHYLGLLLAVGILWVGIVSLDQKINLKGYLEASGVESAVDQWFVSEDSLSLEQIGSGSLLFIYLESIEDGFRNELVYGQNLINDLDNATSATKGWILPRFTENAMPGTEWTIASMTSSMCGVPLISGGTQDANSTFEKVEDFLPNVSCIGDYLESAGYQNVFMGGAALSFAGKGKLLKTHGFQEAWGLENWQKDSFPEDDFHAWGLRDRPLIERAELRLSALQKSSTPYSMFILTSDSHAPAGLIKPDCVTSRSDLLESNIICSTQHVARLLEKIQADSSFDDLTIVVLGDHPMMATLASEPISKVTSSNAMFFRVRPGKQFSMSYQDQVVVPFDVLPTTLNLLGFKLSGDQLGLGFSMFGNSGNIFDRYKSEEDLASSLRAPSENFLRFWKN